MPDSTMTAEDVMQILQKNGIGSIDDLAKSIADQQNGKPFQPSIAAGGDFNPLAAQWVIAVWKIGAQAELGEITDDHMLPDQLGGDVLKSTFGGAVE